MSVESTYRYVATAKAPENLGGRLHLFIVETSPYHAPTDQAFLTETQYEDLGRPERIRMQVEAVERPETVEGTCEEIA